VLLDGLRAKHPLELAKTKNRGRIVFGRGYEERWTTHRFRSDPGSHRGIDAKIAVRDGVHTIVASRGWLNAFVFGFRLAWLSPSRQVRSFDRSLPC
jgi:hypothetical protein